jgi:hypothetical protein
MGDFGNRAQLVGYVVAFVLLALALFGGGLRALGITGGHDDASYCKANPHSPSC